MKIAYSPPGGDPVEFRITLDDLLDTEADLLEQVGGVAWETFGQWINLLLNGSFRAYKALLWVLLRRSDPSLEFADLSMKVGELMVDVADEPGKDEAPEGDAETSTDSP